MIDVDHNMYCSGSTKVVLVKKKLYYVVAPRALPNFSFYNKNRRRRSTTRNRHVYK